MAIEARNLAPLPAGLDHAVAAGAVISGLTAWQALFDHAHLRAGQTVLIHGAAGGVGSIAVQLAREVGSRVIGTGRAADRDRAFGLGVEEFVDLETDRLEDVGQADVVLDVIGGDILKRSTGLVRAGGTLVTNDRTAHDTARERAGDLLRRGGRSLPTRRARPAAARRTTDFECGGRAAVGRSARRVRAPRSACVREDDHRGHRGLVARPRSTTLLIGWTHRSRRLRCWCARPSPDHRGRRCVLLHVLQGRRSEAASVVYPKVNT